MDGILIEHFEYPEEVNPRSAVLSVGKSRANKETIYLRIDNAESKNYESILLTKDQWAKVIQDTMQ